MNAQEFNELITRNNADHVLKVLAAMPEQERRKYAKPARAALKAYEKSWWDRQTKGLPFSKDTAIDVDALGVAVFATGVPSETAKDHWTFLPRSIPLADVVRALKPSWIDRWVSAAVEASPRIFGKVQDLHRAGLCRMPETDAYILGYYAHRMSPLELVNDTYFQKDIWRFFEVEGGGDLSLAAHDKYAREDEMWSNALLKLSDEGTLDRNRLLVASLEALERDFGQFRAGWYSRFHMALAPTAEEQAARADQYLHLLGSAVPPTVSFALKYLKQIDKTGNLLAAPMLESIEPALQSRQKSSASSALQLLKSCAKQNPDMADKIATVATSALISESGEVQERALDLIVQLDQAQAPDIRALLQDYLHATAPTVQARLSDLLGTQPETPDDAPAYPVPQIEIIHPVTSTEEAVATFLELLEGSKDPFLIERAMDGLARFGAQAQPFLSPVAKRAKQVQERALQNFDAHHLLAVNFLRSITATGLAWAKGTTLEVELPIIERGHIKPVEIKATSFEGCFAARANELLGFVQCGQSVPMLSAPTDDRGYLAPAQLIARLQEYRASKVQPGPVDFKLALMRLAPEGRRAALADFQPDKEEERALAYALGAGFAPEKDKQLWVIAWSARLPLKADPKIQALVGGKIPGAGTPTVFEFTPRLKHGDGYSVPLILVKETPQPSPDVDEDVAFGASWDTAGRIDYSLVPNNHPSWMKNTNDWAIALRPAYSELFFAIGIAELSPFDKLADHPCAIYLKPFFRPDLQPGPMAHALLSWYLSSPDGAIYTSTQDAIATLIAQNSFNPVSFADAAHKLMFSGCMPLRSWTKRITEISQISPDHRTAIQLVLDAMLVEIPQDLPRDLGGILELLYELHIASGRRIENLELLSALRSVKVGGKTGKFARKLTEIGLT